MTATPGDIAARRIGVVCAIGAPIGRTASRARLAGSAEDHVVAEGRDGPELGRE
jgi:hypothetical protein